MTTDHQQTGVGFLSLLTLLFIGLKLGGAIDWSWWYVLLPLYLPVAVFVFVMLIAILIALVLYLITINQQRRK